MNLRLDNLLHLESLFVLQVAVCHAITLRCLRRIFEEFLLTKIILCSRVNNLFYRWPDLSLPQNVILPLLEEFRFGKTFFPFRICPAVIKNNIRNQKKYSDFLPALVCARKGSLPLRWSQACTQFILKMLKVCFWAHTVMSGILGGKLASTPRSIQLMMLSFRCRHCPTPSQ